MLGRVVGFPAHYGEHLPAAGAQQPDDQGGGEDQEGDVEDGGVVPADAVVADAGVPGSRRDQAEGAGPGRGERVGSAEDEAVAGTSPGSRARDHMANERTWLAWVRAAVNVMIVGLAVAKFAGDGSSTAYSLGAGALLVAVGGAGLLYGTERFRRTNRELEGGRFVTGAGTRGPVVASVTLLVAIVAALVLVLLGGVG
jgi:putative membrane protein